MDMRLEKKEMDGFLEASKVFHEETRELYEKEREEYFRAKFDVSGVSEKDAFTSINQAIYILLDKKNDSISYIGVFNDFKSLLEAAMILQNQENAVIYEVNNLNYMRINPEGVDSISTLSLSAFEFCKRFKITANPDRSKLADTYTDKRFEKLLNYLWQYIMKQHDLLTINDEALEIYKSYIAISGEVLDDLSETKNVSFYKAICDTAHRLFENKEEM